MSTTLTDALATASDTKDCRVGRGVVSQAGEVFTGLFGAGKALILADENHWRVAGDQVRASLEAAGVEVLEPYLFPASPVLYASYDRVDEIREHLRPLTDVTAVAVASGSLNDLVKKACGELDRQYLCVGTAASMDGYIAGGAALTKDDFKQQMPCPAPAGMVADLDIMAGAPSRLTATGFGDLIEKVPAGADWIIADALGVEPIDQRSFDLVQGSVPDALADPQGCRDGDPEALRGLVEGLMISGLAIQGHGNARPGSGGGHHISHVLEMEGYGLHWDTPLSHGFKVGLGTIACCAMYDLVLSKDIPALVDVDAAVDNWMSWEDVERATAEKLQPQLVDMSLARLKGKYVGKDGVRQRVQTFVDSWPTLSERLRDQLIPTAELQAKLDTVGAVTHPNQVGLSLDDLRATYDKARWIRDRYVLTDILTEAGLFDRFLDELFAPGGYWAEREPLPELDFVP